MVRLIWLRAGARLNRLVRRGPEAQLLQAASKMASLHEA
jgi:hypothetical protein